LSIVSFPFVRTPNLIPTLIGVAPLKVSNREIIYPASAAYALKYDSATAQLAKTISLTPVVSAFESNSTSWAAIVSDIVEVIDFPLALISNARHSDTSSFYSPSIFEPSRRATSSLTIGSTLG
jgi:hypothetical protein